MNDDPRWWKLYREERSKLAPGKAGWKQTLSAYEITRAAREATRRYNEPLEPPDAAVREPRPSSKPPSLSAAVPESSDDAR